jgi:hypothetical protein
MRKDNAWDLWQLLMQLMHLLALSTSSKEDVRNIPGFEPSHWM